MKSKIVFYLSIIIIVLSNTSYRWPVNKGRITSTFCESRWDHFHDGIDMVCPDDKIYPVDTGKLLFFWDKSIFPMEHYPGGGNYKIIKHRNGLYSIYMHLEDGVTSRSVYTKNDLIGMVGNSGHSISKHLHLSLLNSKKRKSVNPFELFPGCEDLKRPKISDIALRIGDRYIIIRDNANIRLTKHYPLLIKITDTITGREKLGIYKLKVTFNKRVVLNFDFKNLSFSKNGLTVSGKRFHNIFDRKGYYRVEGVTYIDGLNTLEISAEDYAGNQAFKEHLFNVKLDMDR